MGADPARYQHFNVFACAKPLPKILCPSAKVPNHPPLTLPAAPSYAPPQRELCLPEDDRCPAADRPTMHTRRRGMVMYGDV